MRMTDIWTAKINILHFSEGGDNKDNKGNVVFWPIQNKFCCHNCIDSFCDTLKTNVNYLRIATETAIDIY